MNTRTVYVSPTPANRKLIAKLRRMPPLTDCEFVFLSEQDNRRHREIEGLGGGAVYIWGNGYAHHESYLLTDRDTRLKVNIDDHSDRGGEAFVAFHNHMSHVEVNGVPIVTPKQNLPQEEKRADLLRRANQAIAHAGEDSVHFTVDLDALTAFPACFRWICTDGISIAEVVGAIRKMDGKTRTFDIGGLANDIPDFDMETLGTPNSFTTRRVVSGGGTRDQIHQVLSYAVRAYYEILTAVLADGTAGRPL